MLFSGEYSHLFIIYLSLKFRTEGCVYNNASARITLITAQNYGVGYALNMGKKRDADFSINKEEKVNKKANLNEGTNTGPNPPDKELRMNDDQHNKMDSGAAGARESAEIIVPHDQEGKGQAVGGTQEGYVTAMTTDQEVTRLRQEMDLMRKDFKEDIRLMSQKFGELVLAHTDSVASLKFHDNFLETLNDKFRTLSRDHKSNEALLVKGEMERKELRSDIARVERYTQDNSKEIKSNNIIVSGLKENKNENILLTVVTFLKKIVSSINGDHVEVAYRMGSDTSKVRPILVKLKDSNVKKQIMKNKSILKDQKSMARVFCNDDLHELSRKNRQRMRITAKYAAKKGYNNVKCLGNKLQIDGKTYQEDELMLLPRELHVDSIMTQTRSGRLFFESSYSYLSGSHKVRFQMNEKTFSSADQALYYHKAILCGRDDVASDLLELAEPKVLKRLGLKLDSNELWEEKKLKVMKNVLLSKFRQNSKICEQLIETNEVPILNCDNDQYWGTGKGMFEKGWDKTFKYPGANVLGTCLEEVRKLLRPAGYTPALQKDLLIEAATSMEGVTEGEARNPNPDKKGELKEELGNIPDIGGQSLATNGNVATFTPTTAKEMSALIKPTTCPLKASLAIQAVDDKTDKDNLSHVSEEDSLEQANKLLHMIRSTLGGGSAKESKLGGDGELVPDVNKCNSNLEDSILFGDTTWEESAVLTDITRDDGRLNREKIANMVIPKMNRSKVLEKSLLDLKEGAVTKPTDAHRDGSLTHSTPVNTKFGKDRGRKPKKKTSSDLKNETLKMLKDLEL